MIIPQQSCASNEWLKNGYYDLNRNIDDYAQTFEFGNAGICYYEGTDLA